MRAGELRKHGLRIRLPDQPLQILRMLLERPGEVVLREEIREALWPNGTVVEFDHSINAAVKRLRNALLDSAEKPRYIETLSRRGYRFIGSLADSQPQEPAIEATKLGTPPRTLERWRVPTWILAAAAILAIVSAWYYHLGAPARWAREVALPEATRLIEAGQYPEAFPLIYKALQVLPHDPALNKLQRDNTYPVVIRATPAGANLYLKPYGSPNGEWLFVGQSPLENFLLAGGYFRWKITKPGFRTLEAAGGVGPPQDRGLEFALGPEGSIPSDMVYVPHGDSRVFGLQPVALDDFLIDKYEVTNRQFKEFIDNGGYQNRDYWREEFVKDGHRLTWENAVAEFRDATGRPGPSTWEVGDYPVGNADFPVEGVSWFEAAAYAQFAKKQLPTVYHWYRAAGQGIYSDILTFSNFSGKGPAQVGSRSGVGPFGTYDMAGNVKEWCSNASGVRRYILGGGWNEGRSYYADADARSPFNRSMAQGFRCVKYIASPLAHRITQPIEKTWGRDYRTERPISDGVFRAILSVYSYDHTELNSKVQLLDESSSGFRVEKITFDAAYDHERMSAGLYLPTNGKPPYQTIIYFPAGAAGLLERTDEAEINRFHFLMKSGRAVLFPIYKGTFDRRHGIPSGPSGQRDLMIQQYKDFRRSVDYLETRKDIDMGRLGYFGISGGSRVGLLILAQDPRIRAAALAAGGLASGPRPPEIDGINFAPRVHIPVLMLNGRDDFPIPLETLQRPMFRFLGSKENEKRFVEFDTGHAAPTQVYVKETLDWFDRFLGPVAK